MASGASEPSSATEMSRNSSSESTSHSTAATSPLHDVPEAGVQSRGFIQPCSDYLEIQSEASLKGRNPRANVFVPKPKSDDNHKPESMVSDLGDNGSCEGCYFRLEVEKQNGDLVIENNDLKTKVADHKAELDRATDAYAQQIHISMGPSEEKIKVLGREVANFDERRKQQEIRHSSELSTVQSQRDALGENISNLETKLKDMKQIYEETLSSLQKRLDDYEDLSNKRLVAAESANIKYSDGIRQLTEENEKLHSRNQQLSDEKAKIENQSQQHSKKIKDLNEDIDKLKQKADSSEREVETKDQEVEKLKGLLKKRNESLHTEKELRKEAEMSDIEAQIKLKTTESRLEKVVRKNKSADDHKNEMKESHEEKEKEMKEKSDADEIRISSLEAKVRRLIRGFLLCCPAFFLLGFMLSILLITILNSRGVNS